MSKPKEPLRFAERVVRKGLQRAGLHDLYHFLLTTTWKQLFALIVVFYLLTNLLFGLVYFLDGGIDNAAEGSYADAFFFSVQTMATIGYGKMAPRSLLANLGVTVEALFGLVGFAMATGLMFAKFSRPSARVIFSKHLVITMREGKRSLLVRLGNERKTGLIEATLRLVMLRQDRTAEGETMRRIVDLPLVRASTAMFALSWTAIHVIDESSPLFGMTTESLHQSEAEIVASLVGLEEATGQTVHARKAWGPDEILFNKRFADILGKHHDGRPLLDYSRFHDVEDDAHERAAAVTAARR